MAIKKVFKSYIPSVNYVTQKGRTCVFVEGRYETDIPEEVAELTALHESKSNPHIYIDPAEVEIDTTLQERIRAAQQEATLKVMAEVAKEKDKSAGNAQASGQQANPQVQQAINPAALLNVTSTAILAKGMSAPSNQK